MHKKLLIFIFVFISMLMHANIAYADTGDDQTIIKAAGITACAVIGGFCLLFGFNNVCLNLLDKTKEAGDGLIDKADAAITVHRVELQSTINDSVSRVEAKIDDIISAVDRVNVNLDKFNPVSQANVLGEKTATFFKKLFTKASQSLTSEHVNEDQVRFKTGLQKALQKLDATGDAGKALEQMSMNDMELLASYTNVSPVSSDSGEAASKALRSVAESHIWDMLFLWSYEIFSLLCIEVLMIFACYCLFYFTVYTLCVNPKK